MKGNKDPTFLNKINGVFICFVTAALGHCLKAWKTGKYVVGPDFKLETAWSKWKGFPTLQQYTDRLRYV